MGYLAYDPARITTLRSAMQDAFSDLSEIRSSDSEAATAMAAVRAARLLLMATWLPDVSAVIDCNVLNSWDPSTLAIRNLLELDPSWLLINDPLSPEQSVFGPDGPSEADITSFIESLASGNTQDLTGTPEKMQRAMEIVIAIKGNRELSAEFVAQAETVIGPWVNSLAEQRQFFVGSTDPAKVSVLILIDTTIREIVNVYANANGKGALPELEQLDPYAAAQMVRWADLPAEELATTSDRLLVRHEQQSATMSAMDDHSLGENTADVLFRAMLDTPGAATFFVILAAAHPATMWSGAADGDLVRRIATEGTDPSNISAADAGPVLSSYIEFFRSTPDSWFPPGERANTRQYRELIGQLAAPFLLQYSPTNPTWGTSVDALDRRRSDLEFLVADEKTLQLLLTAKDYCLEGTYLGSSNVEQSVGEVAGLIGLLARVIAHRRILDAQAAVDRWDDGWTFLNKALGAVPGGGEASTLFLDALKKGMHRLPGILKAAGYGPRSVDDARVEQTAIQHGMAVGATVAVTQAYWEQLGSSGTTGPPSFDPSWRYPMNQYSNAFDAWLKTLPAGVPSAKDLEALKSIKKSFINELDLGQEVGGG